MFDFILGYGLLLAYVNANGPITVTREQFESGRDAGLVLDFQGSEELGEDGTPDYITVAVGQPESEPEDGESSD